MPILTAGSAPSPTATIDEITVILGDIILPGNRANATPDEYGVTWGLVDITGWFEQPESTGQAGQRAADHGAWIDTAYFASRVIEIEGKLHAPSIGEALRALRRVESVIPLSTPDTLLVTSVDGTLHADVRQHGSLLPDKANLAFGRLSFSLSLIAPDPRRYASEETTASTSLPSTSGGMALPLTLPLTIGATIAAGVLSVTNDGNMSTRPTFTVAGPVAAGATITHRGTGKVLRIPDGVPAGRKLTIDTDRRRALLDGTAARVVTGTWFEYAPGVNEVAFSAPTYNASALLISTHRSAWR